MNYILIRLLKSSAANTPYMKHEGVHLQLHLRGLWLQMALKNEIPF